MTKSFKIETAVANSVVQTKEEHNGVYVPPNVVKGQPLHFAIDNIDFENDTPDGKNEFPWNSTGDITENNGKYQPISNYHWQN